MSPQLVALISHGIWKTHPTDEPPTIQLPCRSMREVGIGSSAPRHLVNHTLIEHEGRAFSALGPC